MFCPHCGQERLSDATSFCSRCGFLLTGTTELLKNGGVIPSLPATRGYFSPSPRTRGLKQGLFFFLLTFLIVPIIAISTVALRAPIWGVPIAAILFSMGGLLRVAYALMFESPAPAGVLASSNIAEGANILPDRPPIQNALPGGEQIPASVYNPPRGGTWRDTNDLQPSVTEGTTQLLEKDELPPQ